MNLVFICHYFYPELGAPSARIFETAKAWVELGHNVTIVTCFPNHPTGVISQKYKGLYFKEEEIDGIRVLRNYVYATPNEGFFKKTLGHISFMISSVLFSLFKLKNPDVIIVSSPTYFSVFSAYFMSLVKRAPFIFEVRDLWPEAIVKLGVLKNKVIISILEFFEMYFYNKAAKVIVVTKSFKDNLVRRGVNADKIEVITNGVDESFFISQPNEEIKILKEQFGLKNKFVVLYIGAHGISHALDKVIKVAEILRDNKSINFLFVGEGAEKKKIIKQAEELGLENVIFLPGQPKDRMPAIYGLADICLVPLKKIELFKEFIPSKIFEIMACKKPIIASLEGEAKEILLDANSAVVVEPENSEEIASAILNLKNDKDLRNRFAENGRKFVQKSFTRKGLAQKYINILERVSKGKDQ